MATQYCLEKAVGDVSSKKALMEWWLRTVGQYQFTFVTVQTNGDLLQNGIVTTIEFIGVRPVIWIDFHG